MVVSARTVAGIVPGLQATSILALNLPKKDEFSMKPSKKMATKKPVKRIVQRGIGTIVGVGLLRPTSQMIHALPH